MGILIVKKSIDAVDYEYKGGKNILTKKIYRLRCTSHVKGSAKKERKKGRNENQEINFHSSRTCALP